MASDMKVGLTLEAEDRASAVLRRASSDAVRQAERTASRSSRIAADAQRTQERAAVRQRTAEERSARAREQLGIRSERTIRREIQLTEAAYNRLARSGRMSATEQTRAYAQMQQRVAGLRQEMVGLERQQRRGLGSGMMRVGAGMFQAGVVGAAAGMTLARPISRTMDYDQRLRYMANTAFGDNGQAGRAEGYKTLKDSVESTVGAVGGDRDEAAGALSKMLNDGTLTGTQATKLLPTVQAVAVGQGANAQDVGALVNALVKTGGVSIEDIPRALDQVVKATKEGPIEFAELVRDLPRILGQSGQLGIGGIDNLPALLSAIEGSMATAGSASEGMNNVFNWLSKLNSQDAIRSAAKIEISPGKSIDLVGQLAEYRAKGMNVLQGYDAIMDKVVAADPNVARVEKQLRNANPAERQKILESQYALFSGSAISQLLPDRQALMGYLSYRYMDKDKRAAQISSIENSLGANAEDLAFIQAGPSAGLQAGKNAFQAAEFEVFKPLTEGIGKVSGELASLAAQYPEMTKAVVTVTYALAALSAAALGRGAFNVLRGNGRGPLVSGPGPGSGPISPGAVSGAAAGGSKIMRGISKVGVAGPAVAGLGAYQAYQVANDSTLTDAQKTDQYISLGARSGGAWAGMRAGAIAGSYLGPWGTLVGGVAGGFGGDYLGDGLAQYIQHLRQTAPTAAESQAAMAAAPNVATMGQSAEQMRQAIIDRQREANKEPRKLDVNVTVDVKNGNIVAEVERVQERESWRH